jgi:hypothetical protein
LGASRRTTRALGLAFADDPSNATPRFERNRLRALLESFGAEQPRLEAALASLAETARSSTRLLDAVALAAGESALTGLDEPAVTTLLVHLGRARGARGIERRALAGWARALVDGRRGAFSLGQGLRGSAHDGRADVVGDDDPRRTVVAWRPGTYRGSAMEMAITTGDHGDHDALAEGESLVRRDGVQWPLRLEVAGPREPGFGGDELDFVSGDALGGWRVVDASGRTLVPGGAEGGIAMATGGGGGRAGPSRAGEDDWIRIVLKPLSRARAG